MAYEYRLGSTDYPYDPQGASVSNAALVFLSSEAPEECGVMSMRGYLRTYLMPKLLQASRSPASAGAVTKLQNLVNAVDDLAILGLEKRVVAKPPEEGSEPGFAAAEAGNPLSRFRKAADGYDANLHYRNIEHGARTLRQVADEVNRIPNEHFVPLRTDPPANEEVSAVLQKIAEAYDLTIGNAIRNQAKQPPKVG